uniref:Uncharacterized protein n=1 Tax=Globodera rostochiensis TaxID=31243 RepID=A0A914IDD2_GLORO
MALDGSMNEKIKRAILCQTHDGKVIEVPWNFMVQSHTFLNMWKDLGMEDHIVAGRQEQVDEFIFPLNGISKPIFDQIQKWMENHENQPEPKLNEDSLTNERVCAQGLYDGCKFFGPSLIIFLCNSRRHALHYG